MKVIKNVVLVDYWTSFAKTGNPNNENCPNWSAFDPHFPQWMILDNNKLGMTNIDRELKYELLNKRTMRHIEALKGL